MAILLTFPMPGGGYRSLAQASGQPKIEAEPFFTLAPNIETAFPVRIDSAGELPKRASLLIKGIPGSLTLSEGRVFDSGIWFVPASDLPKLKIQASSEATGLSTPLSITLVALDGTVLAEGLTILEVSPAPGQAPATVQTSAKSQSTATVITNAPDGTGLSQREPAGKPISKPPQPLAISPAEEEERLKSGQIAWELDDVAGARLIFEYLANRGSAAGAWRLAQTYDPHILARTTVGAKFKPDEAVAARWYAKAAAMGHEEARKKIAGNR